MARKTDTIADYVSFAPTDALATVPPGVVAASESETTYRKKAKYRATYSKPWTGDAVKLYDGWEGLLVRTLLMRSEAFDKLRGKKPVVRDAEDVCQLLQHVGFHDQEHMVELCMNVRMEVVAIYELAIGTSSGAATEAMHAVKVPILTAARNVILAHNHPGGSPLPSDEDMQLTRRLCAAFKCLDINLVDHVIVTWQGCYSMVGAGRMPC